MSICRIYPLFHAGKRFEVRVQGENAMVLSDETKAAIIELIGAVHRLAELDVRCDVINPDTFGQEGR